MILPVRNPRTPLQVYGFDILLDSGYQASLIEVNTGPDLASNTPLDKMIKYQMVSDLLHLVGVQPYDRWAACLWKRVRPWYYGCHDRCGGIIATRSGHELSQTWTRASDSRVPVDLVQQFQCSMAEKGFILTEGF